jgi:amino-acid N-acetyltransferase
MTIQLRPAQTDDWAAIAQLLQSYSLPLDGVQAHLADFWVAHDAEQAIVGVAGVELYGTSGLLRSVAVAQRQQGLGQQLVQHLINTARTSGLHELVLLTETAADYFPRFGFRPIQRQDAPISLHQSAEFQGACPQSAVVMHLAL